MKELLLFNVPEALKKSIENLCLLQEIIVKEIEPTQFGMPLGVLAGVVEHTGAVVAPADKSITDEILLFVNFDQESLTDFLARYRAAGIPKVNLKAGLTPNNVSWDVYMLHEELLEEHAAMSKLKK